MRRHVLFFGLCTTGDASAGSLQAVLKSNGIASALIRHARRSALAEPVHTTRTPCAGKADCHNFSRNRDVSIQVHILNVMEQIRSVGHRSLERFASADQAHSTGPLVDDSRTDRLCQIRFT